MKKFLSTILAVVMVLSSMAMVVSAETTGTITVYNAAGIEVEGSYTTIDTAAAAAGVNGKIELSEGIFEFGARQTIQVEGVDLIGAGKDKTFIVATDGFATASATNKKALLTIAASNVEISGVTIDGSEYGDDIEASADFNVIRINDGDNVVLTNVAVTGSPRSLITIGTESTDAKVSATYLFCDAETDKVFTDITDLRGGFADIDVTNGEFTLGEGSVINGFITDDVDDSFTNNCEANHFSLAFDRSPLPFIWHDYDYVTATVKHYVDTWNNATLESDETSKGRYIDALSYNSDVVEDMAEYAIANKATDLDTAEGLYDMIDYAITEEGVTALSGAKTILAEGLGK